MSFSMYDFPRRGPKPATQVLRELGKNRRVADAGFLVDGTDHLTILAGTDLSGDPDCPGGFYIVGTVGHPVGSR